MDAKHPHFIEPNIDDLIKDYLTGKSAREVSKKFGISDSTIRKRLCAAGIEIRGRGTYPPHTMAAHEARRGQVDSDAVKRQRASTRQRLQLHTSSVEGDMACISQLAVNFYNVDLALTELPIAVEIVAGGYTARRRAMLSKRLEYLLNAGFHVIEVHMNKVRPLRSLDGAADYIVAYTERLRRNPAAPCEHRVIRPDGEEGGSRRPYLN